MRHRIIRALPLILVAATAASILNPTSAPGAPIDDKRSEAAQLEQQITENGRKMDALNEQINSAQIALDSANDAIALADSQVAAATKKTKELRSALAERAATLYRGAGVSTGIANLDARSANELNSREKYTSLAAQREKTLVTQLAAAKEELRIRKHDAEDAREAASAKRSEIQATKSDLASADNKQRGLLSQVKGQIADLVAQEQAAREARDRAAAQARLLTLQTTTGPTTSTTSTATRTSTSTSTSKSTAPAPAPSGGASSAVAYAYAQLGKPYCYAGVGPSCFDCSGLTMMAWAQGGVSMPHGSTEQWNMFPHVPLSQAQPGDLIVWDGHVGIYIGGGQVIHAPHTGDVVKIASIWGSPWGAARPG
jgi:cell wall-associated NlpC family hydrolase